MKFLPLLQRRGDEIDLNITFLSINQCGFRSLNEFCGFPPISFQLSPGAAGTRMGCEIPLSGTELIIPQPAFSIVHMEGWLVVFRCWWRNWSQNKSCCFHRACVLPVWMGCITGPQIWPSWAACCPLSLILLENSGPCSAVLVSRLNFCSEGEIKRRNHQNAAMIWFPTMYKSLSLPLHRWAAIWEVHVIQALVGFGLLRFGRGNLQSPGSVSSFPSRFPLVWSLAGAWLLDHSSTSSPRYHPHFLRWFIPWLR